MKDKLDYLLKEHYNQDRISTDVKNGEIRKYEITVKISYLTDIYESKFIYTYDNLMTLAENFDNIVNIIDNEIILKFYKR